MSVAFCAPTARGGEIVRKKADFGKQIFDEYGANILRQKLLQA